MYSDNKLKKPNGLQLQTLNQHSFEGLSGE